LREHNLALRDDSTLCNKYIENNIGDVNEIVTIMVEMDFYFKYTQYSNILYNQRSNYIDNERSYRYYDWDYYITLTSKDKTMLSTSAKKEALKLWCNKRKDCDDAISQPYLPRSLRDKVLEHFSN